MSKDAPTTALQRYLDPALSENERVNDLLPRLTLEEKISALGTDPSVPRLGIRASGHVEGLHGLALGGPGKWGGNRPLPTTTFCQATGLAACWDPALITRVADAEATEARFYFHHSDFQRGGVVVRAPNADLGRDPRWGRSEECYGEDAFLTSTMAVAFTRGLQGDHPRYWKTAALLKHFLANSNEDERTHSSSDFDERLFHEYYAAPFRECTAAGSRAAMTAYNAHNGVPCTVHPTLESVVRRRWGQDGILCTDEHAMTLLTTDHSYCEDLATAAAKSLKAGITQFLDNYVDAVGDALKRGLISEEEIDQALAANFRVMLRLGLLDPESDVPYARVGDQPPHELLAHQQLAREVTAKSIVLLKNSSEFLPIATQRAPGERPMKIALLGRLADRVHQDWYSGTPAYHVTPAAGIRERLGKEVELLVVSNNDTSEIVAAAAEADLCIFCLGNHPTGDSHWGEVTRASYGKEMVDRRSLELEEERLVREVFAVNPRIALVLISSFPYAINWSQENIPAIVWMTHGGQELGNALASVLFGDVCPGGRLVQTWPKSIEQLPELLDYNLANGRTYMYSKDEPLYPFGYGLSYTAFRHTELTTNGEKISKDGEVVLSVTVGNTGSCEGDDVVQIYAKFPNSRIPRPLLQLVAFERVTLNAGQSQRLELRVPASRFQHWDVEKADFAVEAGKVQLLLGRSSSDIVLETSVEIG